MYVSIALDPGSEGRAKELADLVAQYGFERVQRGLWESALVTPDTLDRLKRDLDRAADAFDRLRIFQFPVNGTLALSTLKDKKWRRVIAAVPAVVQQTRKTVVVTTKPAAVPIKPKPAAKTVVVRPAARQVKTVITTKRGPSPTRAR